MSLAHTYAFKVLLFFDMFLCALIWRDTGITISSMTGLALLRANPPRWARVLGWVLNTIEADHTTLAIAHDIERSQSALFILRGQIKP